LSAGFQITPSGVLNTTESGGTAVFRVRLTEQPTAPVQLPLCSSNPGEGVPLVEMLTFTPENWRTYQSVTVRGVDDEVPVVDGKVSYSILTGPAISADARYHGQDPADVRLKNRDNDRAAVLLSSTSLTTTMFGEPASLWISLATKPFAPVSIRLRPSPATSAYLCMTTVVINPDQWESGVEVQVNGTDNARYTYQIITDPAVSMDPAYQRINPGNVRCTNVVSEIPLYLFNGTYEGTYTGTLRSPKGARMPESGGVHATVVDGIVTVVLSDGDTGSGILTSSGATDFRVTYGSVGGDAHFTGKVRRLASGVVVASGNWTYADSYGWTGSGTWSVTRNA
jgi:hypothetical protein